MKTFWRKQRAILLVAALAILVANLTMAAPDLESIQAQIDGVQLLPQRAVHVENLTINTGLAKLVVPATGLPSAERSHPFVH